MRNIFSLGVVTWLLGCSPPVQGWTCRLSVLGSVDAPAEASLKQASLDCTPETRQEQENSSLTVTAADSVLAHNASFKGFNFDRLKVFSISDTIFCMLDLQALKLHPTTELLEDSIVLATLS